MLGITYARVCPCICLCVYLTALETLKSYPMCIFLIFIYIFIYLLLLMLAEMQQAEVCQETLQHQAGKLHHFAQEEIIP